MLVITVHVNRPPGQAIGIKEQIAQDLEKYGDTKVVSVEEVLPPKQNWEQMKMIGIGQREGGVAPHDLGGVKSAS